MCGRYSLAVETSQLAERFNCSIIDQIIERRYNVAPTQIMPVVVKQADQRRLQMMHWGLIPFWAKDKSMGSKLINARVETVEQKASFKHAIKERRCIVPVDGYYEWQKTNTGKQAMRIIMPSNQLFGLAGLWEEWISPDGQAYLSYTILTTAPTPSLAPIHHRMPLVLNREQEDYWLHGLQSNNAKEIRSFLNKLKPAEELTAYPVSNLVNNPRSDDPRCIQPIA